MEMTRIIGAAKLWSSLVSMCPFDECSYNLIISLYLLQNVGRGLRDQLAQYFYFGGKVIELREVKSLDLGQMTGGGDTGPKVPCPLSSQQHSGVGVRVRKKPLFSCH